MKSNRMIKRILSPLAALLVVLIFCGAVSATDYGVILLDRSGSMTILRADDNSRFYSARHRAIMRAVEYTGAGYQLAVVTFNATEGFILRQDFTDNVTTLITVISNIPDAVTGPRTPIADAMCFATQMLVDQVDGDNLVLMTLTDGDHNERYDPPGGAVCNQCEIYPDDWNNDCDPDDQDNYPCTDWQDCLVIVWAMNTVHVVDYFGDPVVKSGNNLSAKAEMIELEEGEFSRDGGDYRLFEFLADFSEGEIIVITDSLMPDMDGDSIEDVLDNCPNVYNPGQEDSDTNGVGDACQCDCEPGNANGDGTYNIFDVTYMIGYLYMDGPAPQPYEVCSGDPNCDCICNIFDVTHLIGYLYMYGLSPCDCNDWLSACGPPLRK
jgi:hypothetical protein